jgi:hypothetical protein
MIFAALDVPGVGTPEGNQSSDVNFRAERLISTQYGTPGGGLNAQIANGL